MAKVDIEEWTAKARLDWYSPGSNVDFESAKRRHRENLKALRLAQEEREEDGRPIHVLVLHGSGRHEMLSCAREASNSQMFLDRCLDVALEEWSGEREVRVRRRVLRELYMNPCNGCYSAASALCGFSCTCFPQDDISTVLYPDIMWADVLLFSTPINQAGCSTRLKTVLDRLISLDGGYAEKELPVKNEEYREQAIALSQKKPVYDKRMFGRVAAYFISSKDMNNEHEEAVETPEEFAHLSYADLTVGQLAVQGAEYGWFHAKPFWAAWAADPDQEMSFDKAHLDAFLPLDEGVEVILAALKKADYLHRNPPRLEAPGRYNRT